MIHCRTNWSEQFRYIYVSLIAEEVLSEATAVYQVAPAWVSYAAHSRMSGRPERFLRTRYEDGWKLTDETVQPLLDDPPGHQLERLAAEHVRGDEVRRCRGGELASDGAGRRSGCEALCACAHARQWRGGSGA
mgnify:CR=1 FL=1